ncbi:MAG TPA: helix-turn-helix domain-containing protein [Polyangiaceae bacterium]|jgi:cytoskeletal protein RodZ|nr:helix-turn-helix domain-containing protein [Polyangiaceae bacterium]
MEPVGQYLRRQREARRMSLEEVARATRVPLASMERLEAGQFDELPGEVFVRGFLRSYARAVDVPCDEVLARYTASRRTAWVTPLPISTPMRPARGGRFGVAIAFVLLLFLFALALSIVLKPRSHDMPQELSQLQGAEPAAVSGAEPGRNDLLRCSRGPRERGACDGHDA